MTATMIMQLRDDGRLSLDDPLLRHLPGFRNADMKRLGKVTIRHLLSHQSGIDGDFFPPMGCGDDAIAQLLEKSAMLPSLFEPGSNWSYSNVGFSALGRVIEVLDNRTFDDSLKKRIFEPLDMQHAMSKPEDNMRFRVAVGHLPGKKGPVVPDYPYLSPGHKAAGATPAMTASDLIRFAAAHMHDGTGLNGHKLLKVRSAREMRSVKVRFRKGDPNKSGLGLAWIVGEWQGHKVFNHDGGTLGQYSQLVACPEKRFAVAVLTNGGNAQGVFRDVLGELFRSQARVKPAGLPAVDVSVKPVAAELCGCYGNVAGNIVVSESNGNISIVVDQAGATQTHELQFCSPRLARFPMGLVELGGRRGERAPWLRLGSRLFNRVA